MKKLILIFLAAVAIISVAFLAFAAEENKPAEKVIAYYFHGRFRCSTCTTMEKYCKEAIETNFKDALASGKLKFKAINVEEPANEHFINDYKLYTKSLILSFHKDGKEIKSKNLDKIWEYARNKQKFITYIAEEIRALLAESK